MTMVPVVVTHLVMDTPAALTPPSRAPANVSLHDVTGAAKARTAAECYRAVGGPWHWVDRRAWDDAQWQAEVNSAEVEVWTAQDEGGLAGYFQLRRVDDAIEIQYFGLLPDRVGRGIGGWLLTHAVKRAWSLAPRRVFLETCTLDGPAALPNYLARGFRIDRQEQRERALAS